MERTCSGTSTRRNCKMSGHLAQTGPITISSRRYRYVFQTHHPHTLRVADRSPCQTPQDCCLGRWGIPCMGLHDTVQTPPPHTTISKEHQPTTVPPLSHHEVQSACKGTPVPAKARVPQCLQRHGCFATNCPNVCGLVAMSCYCCMPTACACKSKSATQAVFPIVATDRRSPHTRTPPGVQCG